MKQRVVELQGDKGEIEKKEDEEKVTGSKDEVTLADTQPEREVSKL